MKRLLEIQNRLAELEIEVRDGKGTDATLEEIKKLSAEAEQLRKDETEAMNRAAQAKGITIPTNAERQTNTKDTEYRQAFRDFFGGKRSSLREFEEFRATTETGDIGSIIPESIVNKIITKMEVVGNLYPRFTKTALQGGVKHPISNVVLTASWVDEGTTATEQGYATGVVEFTYHKVQVKVGITLMAEVVSLDVWEATVAEKMAQAIVKALEVSSLTGAGTASPLGMLVDTRITGDNLFEFDARSTGSGTWLGWNKDFLAKLPQAYEDDPDNVIIVNKKTFFTYMRGLTDDNGQPLVVTENDANGKPRYYFQGYEVIRRSEVPDFDAAVTAGAGARWLLWGSLKNYVINSNMQMITRTYIDEDTDKRIRKTTMIADGKLADVNGMVALTAPVA